MKTRHITQWEAQEIFLEAFNISPYRAQKVLVEYKDLLENVTIAQLVRGR